MLPAAVQAEILRLAYADHWSLTRIAHHVGVNWKSVRKVVQRRSVALARARPRPRTTLLTPFTAQLQALLARDPERSAVNCLQALRAAGYRGGITTLRMALYGPAPVEAALGACLAQAIVGSDYVARWLRLQTQGPVAPPPLTLGDPRLTVPPVRPNLAPYDALLLDADAAASPTEEPDGPAEA